MINLAIVILRLFAMSLSDDQNSFSRLTLVLWPSKTTDRFLTTESIYICSAYSSYSDHTRSIVAIEIRTKKGFVNNQQKGFASDQSDLCFRSKWQFPT